MKIYFGIILLGTIVLTGCHKENGKNDYLMNLNFESGDVFTDEGVIHEKYHFGNKYDGTPYNNALKVGNGNVFYSTTFGERQFIKMDNNRLVNAGNMVLPKISTPLHFANEQQGSCYGDIYLEGSYTQKGRAYTLENGTFEFYWRNAEVFGMTDTILKGTWTLKRK